MASANRRWAQVKVEPERLLFAAASIWLLRFGFLLGLRSFATFASEILFVPIGTKAANASCANEGAA
jgi:hypothetical protein